MVRSQIVLVLFLNAMNTVMISALVMGVGYNRKKILVSHLFLSRRFVITNSPAARESRKMILEASAGFESAPAEDTKLFSAAASRNTQPIVEILKDIIGTSPSGDVVSVAEGSGQHVAAFAQEFSNLRFLPTDIDATALASIAVYRRFRKDHSDDCFFAP